MGEAETMSQIRVWGILVACNIPVYFGWGWVLFRTWGDFWEAVVFWIKPELWSWAEGEYWDDVWAEAKLTIWFFAPIGLMRLELWLLGM